MAESSRKMQELRAQIQVHLHLLSAVKNDNYIMNCLHYSLNIYNLFPKKGPAETSGPPAKDGRAWRWNICFALLPFHTMLCSSNIAIKHNMNPIQPFPDLDEASRAELDAIQGNLAKLKGRKGLDDLDVDEWVDKNKRVKAVTIIFYETSL